MNCSPRNQRGLSYSHSTPLSLSPSLPTYLPPGIHPCSFLHLPSFLPSLKPGSQRPHLVVRTLPSDAATVAILSMDVYNVNAFRCHGCNDSGPRTPNAL